MQVAPAPERLGKYRIESTIGQGAMGVVYKAYDVDIDRPVAVKVLHSHLLDNDSGKESAVRFKQEATAAARCMHTNIVTVFDYGITEDAHYIVMEYIEGINLRSLLREEKRIAFAQAADIIFQVLSALEYAHSCGVIHRDIKPANIMILHNGHVKVADFGVARLENSDLTQAGFMIGTPGYIAPEGRCGDTVDARCDLYAVGVVFYEILTGNRLNAEKLLNRNDVKNDLAGVIDDPDIAQKVYELLITVLDERPDMRFQNATEFLQQLGLILSPDHKHVPDTDELAATVLCSITNAKPETNDQAEITQSAISQIERVLVTYVGPMASLLVKKYARKTANLNELLDAVAMHIPTSVEQTEFRSTITTSGLTMTSSLSSKGTSGAKARTAGASKGFDLPEPVQAEVQKLLALYLGPLASRIANKMQRGARDWQSYTHLLAEHIPNTEEQKQFIQKMSALRQR